MISFSRLKYYWSEYSFEIVCCLCLLFLFLFTIYNKISGSKGSWANSYFFLDKKSKSKYGGSNEDDEDKPKRGDSKGELECRRVLEKIFNKPFNKARPNFLRNHVTGGKNNLELDCFNEELELAVEYDGEGHAKYIPYFHKNYEAFLNQKYRDDMKNRICRDEGIYLIRVPHTVKLHEIKDFIERQLVRYYKQY